MNFSGSLRAIALAFGLHGLPIGAQLPRIPIPAALPTSRGAGEQQIIAIIPGRRTYFAEGANLWMYDHATRERSSIATGAWDASVSPSRSVIAFVKEGARRGEHHVWLLRLDSATGRPRGPEWRLGTGDSPSISHDDRLVAFARNDESGPGQILMVASTDGAGERPLTRGMRSGIQGITWSRNGMTLHFGVALPPPCVPEWSCLSLPNSTVQVGTIRRIDLAGGAPTIVVASARSVTPGMSPDGSAIVYSISESGRSRWIVANVDGSRRAEFALAPNELIQGWLSGATLLIGEMANGQSLRGVSSLDITRPR